MAKVNLSVCFDMQPLKSALSELETYAGIYPSRVCHFLAGVEDFGDLHRLKAHPEEVSGAGQIRIVAEPSAVFARFLAGLDALDQSPGVNVSVDPLPALIERWRRERLRLAARAALSKLQPSDVASGRKPSCVPPALESMFEHMISEAAASVPYPSTPWQQEIEALDRLAQQDALSAQPSAAPLVASAPATRWARISAVWNSFRQRVAAALDRLMSALTQHP